MNAIMCMIIAMIYGVNTWDCTRMPTEYLTFHHAKANHPSSLTCTLHEQALPENTICLWHFCTNEESETLGPSSLIVSFRVKAGFVLVNQRTNNLFVLNQNGTLFFNKIRYENEGSYRCKCGEHVRYHQLYVDTDIKINQGGNQVPSINPKENVFSHLFSLTRTQLFGEQPVCVPQPVSVTGGISWTAHSISKCDTCSVLQSHNSNPVNIVSCHNVTVPVVTSCCVPGENTCNTTSLPKTNVTELITPSHFPWCIESTGESPSLGEIPKQACAEIYALDDEGTAYRHSSRISQKLPSQITLQGPVDDEDCVKEGAHWHNLLALTQICRLPAPVGTYWLCGTTAWSELPSRFNGRCTLAYLYPSMRSKQEKLQLTAGSTDQSNTCIPGLTCQQTLWSRTLGALIPSYGVMQSLDQIRTLSRQMDQLINDTVFALNNISLALASHRMMILQNRIALDYLLSSHGGTCSVVGPECCTDVMNPKEDLSNIITDLRNLHDQVSTMNNSETWLYGLLGPLWHNIVEIGLVLLCTVIAIFIVCFSFRFFIVHMFRILSNNVVV
ncbi:syncytin-A-like [Astyanax mexicanus]|uniref:syncytin-A-like n=1 Tax=Astyanax mexicanus TaxID=7994 RepID=UPI0020CB624D|nr:syncytin-A-like [Astyanax mexicanus]